MLQRTAAAPKTVDRPPRDARQPLLVSQSLEIAAKPSACLSPQPH